MVLTNKDNSIDRKECRKTSQSMALVLIAIGFFRWWSADLIAALPLFLSALGIIAIGITRPMLLIIPTRIWQKIFNFLGRIQSVIFFFLIYFFLAAPIGLIRKRKDVLKMKDFKNQDSSWVDRTGDFSEPSRLY